MLDKGVGLSLLPAEIGDRLLTGGEHTQGVDNMRLAQGALQKRSTIFSSSNRHI
jgi:hypothetical protein